VSFRPALRVEIPNAALLPKFWPAQVQFWPAILCLIVAIQGFLGPFGYAQGKLFGLEMT
jgi:hypothetical protein